MAAASLPAWAPTAAISLIAAAFLLAAIWAPHPDWDQTVSVAFIGNSMQYYNDVPRTMEAISSGHIVQNSCLHGDATISNLLQTGNGMYLKWSTNASLDEETGVHDYGACSVTQLLFGYDGRLDEWGQAESDDYLQDDGTNPCVEDESYLAYLRETAAAWTEPEWDFIVINDNTRSPGIYESREASLETLRNSFVPSLKNMEGAIIPVFLSTHAYWSEDRDMTGLEDIPVFTSKTYYGYQQYAALLEEYLPAAQHPRIAPSGIAWLLIYEENPDFWLKLFHSDNLHASPYGTFLQCCVLYYTIFGRMPLKEYALPSATNGGMSALWSRARRMQPPSEPENPMPTRKEAEYLYHIAERVVKYGHKPKSFIDYWSKYEGAPEQDDDEQQQEDEDEYRRRGQ